jgi:predicted amino acid-binding ACT domain protein
MLEAVPEGSTLFIQNHDEPGVVGTIGTVLGEAGINISRMQLGLVPERREAAMLVNIDRAPESGVLETLRGLPNMISVQLVELGR